MASRANKRIYIIDQPVLRKTHNSRTTQQADHQEGFFHEYGLNCCKLKEDG
jgi:hypothetical protein